MKRLPPELRAPLAAIGVVAVVVVLRVLATGIQPYGTDGAAWIEHVARVQTAMEVRDGHPDMLDRMDGEFPPGLHLVTLPLSAALGHDAAVGVALTGVLWMLLLAAGVGLVTAALADRRIGWLAAALVCFLPAVHGAATRYYYDLPLLALIWFAAGAVLTWGERRPVVAASIATAALTLAWSVKWFALPTGLPVIVAAAVVARPGAGRWAWRSAIVAVVSGGLMVLGALWFLGAAGDFNSLDQARQIMGSNDPLLVDVHEPPSTLALAWQRVVERPVSDVAFYAGRAIGSVLSPLLTVALLAGLVAAVRRRLGRPVLLLALAAGGNLAFVYAMVPVLDDRFVVPSAVALVPAAACGLAALGEQRARLIPAVLALGVLVTVEFHASPSGFWNASILLWDSEHSQFHPGDSSGEAGHAYDRPGKARPAVIWRGPFGGSSIEDRGWTRRDEQPPAFHPERVDLLEAVLALEPDCIAVPAEAPGFDRRGDAFWWQYRVFLERMGGNDALSLTPSCEGGPIPPSCDPDVVVLPRNGRRLCVSDDFASVERPEGLPGLAVPAPEDIAVVTPVGMVLPRVERGVAFPLSVTVTIEAGQISVDGMTIASLQGDPPAPPPGDLRGQLLVPLHDALRDKAAQAESIAAARGVPFDGVVAVLADAGTPFAVVRSVIYTGGQARFTRFVFGALDAGGERVGVPVELPVITPPATDQAASPRLELTVVPGADGFTLHSAVLSDRGGPETLPCGTAGCPDDDAWDHAALSRRARELAAGFPDEDAAIVVPTRGASLTWILRTAAALHVDEEGILFERSIVAGGLE